MKKIMEMLQNMKAKNEKKDNKGFSLVELIIVIAIMAILVGIVGTQVLPYINKSKEAKDFQIINSYGTAATTAYASNAESVPTNSKTEVVIKTVAPGAPAANSGIAATLEKEINDLTGYEDFSKFKAKMQSTKGKDIDSIKIIINPTNNIIDGVEAKTIVTQAYHGTDKVFDEVVTQL